MCDDLTRCQNRQGVRLSENYDVNKIHITSPFKLSQEGIKRIFSAGDTICLFYLPIGCICIYVLISKEFFVPGTNQEGAASFSLAQ